jgi:hypothetical protein
LPDCERWHEPGRTRVKGRKRHLVTDTLGLMLRIEVHSASVQDRDGAALVLDGIARRCPFLERIFADAGYQGPRVAAAAVVHAWAIEADIDPAAIRSNSFQLEWPPRSGQLREFPEVDRAAWFGLAEARSKIHKGQVGFLDDLQRRLDGQRASEWG